MPDSLAYNVPKILYASVVVVFTAKTEIDEQHLNQILNHEEHAGRFRTPKSKLTQKIPVWTMSNYKKHSISLKAK